MFNLKFDYNICKVPSGLALLNVMIHQIPNMIGKQKNLFESIVFKITFLNESKYFMKFEQYDLLKIE